MLSIFKKGYLADCGRSPIYFVTSKSLHLLELFSRRTFNNILLMLHWYKNHITDLTIFFFSFHIFLLFLILFRINTHIRTNMNSQYLTFVAGGPIPGPKDLGCISRSLKSRNKMITFQFWVTKITNNGEKYVE